MFNVNDFTKLDIIPEFEVLTGAHLISEKNIEYISFIEAPVDNFIRKNELVISTAKGCDTDELLKDFISDIIKSQASALVVAKESDDFKLSDEIKAFVENHDFIIIVIPWEVKFSDLLEIVLQIIRDNTLKERNFYEQIQTKLLQSYLKPENITFAAKIIANDFNCDVAILDVNYQLIGFSNEEFCNYPINKWYEYTPIKIISEERTLGYLIIEPNENTYPFNEELIHNYFNYCLVLWFNREWRIYATQQNAKDNFVAQLTKENFEANKDINAHALLLGFNMNLSYTCLVGKLYYKVNEDDDSIVKLDDWLYDKWVAIKQYILDSGSRLKKKVMFTHRDNAFIIYLENDKNPDEEKTHAFLNHLEKAFEASYEDVFFRWGISDITEEIYGFAKKFENARLAQKLCATYQLKTRRYTYEDTIVYHIITNLSNNTRLQNDLYNLISPLIDYDKQHNTQLSQTLKTHLETRNASETAKILHLHRQSLLYRLRKIESLTKLSLKDYDNTFLLETALRLHFDFIKNDMLKERFDALKV